MIGSFLIAPAFLIASAPVKALPIYESLPFETLSVDSRLNVFPSGQSKVFSSNLEAGRSYKFVASSYWTPDYRPPIGVSADLNDYVTNPSLLNSVSWLVDPRFVFSSHYLSTVEDDAPPYGDFGLFSSALGGDNDDFWGAYSPTHQYISETIGAGSAVDFYVSDINFDDNFGNYKIEVYREAVPGPLPMLGVGIAWSFSRKLRLKIRKNK